MSPGGATGISGGASVKRPPWLFLSGIVFFFSLIFFRLSCEQGYYEKGGLKVQGVVTQKAYSPGSSKVGAGSSSSYYVMYKFTTKDGRTFDGKDDVLPELWRKVKVGDQIAVEYLVESPDTNQIPGQRGGSNTFQIMALGGLLAGLALLGLGLWKNRPKH